MQANDDMALLREYAAHNSEAAFAEFVNRRIGFVYSAAFRQVRNAHLAEEITQAVFVLLAQKARQISEKTILTGWLFRTTRFVALAQLRAVAKRQRLAEELQMQNEFSSMAANSLWEQLSPLLDEALAALNEKDRQAVLLRFFDNKSLAEIGAILDVEENTAGKRTSRALQKLEFFFARRGIHSTASTIAETISANSVQAAPVALAKTATAIALSKGVTASASTATLIKGALKIMAWTNAKTAAIVGAALILASGTSVVVVSEIHATVLKEQALQSLLNSLPQTPLELNAWYIEPPVGQNAATVVLQGIKAMQLAGANGNPDLPILGNAPPPIPTAPLPPAEKSALTECIQDNGEALQFFSQAAKYDQSRYPVDLSKGFETPLPHLPGIRHGMQLAEMAAILDAENQDGQQAANDVQTILALAGSLKAEPVLISQLVRISGVSMAVGALNQAMNRTTLPPDSLNTLSNAFRGMEAYDAQGTGLDRAMAGELALNFVMMQNPDELTHYLLTDTSKPASWRQQMLEYAKQPDNLKAERDYFKTTVMRFLSFHQEPFPARLKADDVLLQRGAKAANLELLINTWYWSGYSGPVSREAISLANSDLALTALALEQFRSTHGRYPDKLSELNDSSTWLTDPFDGKPLRYRKQSSGYVLYSIGPDLKDNGGRPMTGSRGDMVFSVTTPP